MWQHASSNRAYRLVWNRAKGIWAVAPETAKGQGKAGASSGTVARVACGSRRLPWRLAILAGLGLLARPSLSFALDANALPGGGQVGAGQAQITVHGNQLTVNQSSRRAVIDWQRFDVGRDAAVRFNQPGADAATLNRVTGGSRSEILGKMDANGQVYLVNGAGVLFGQSAQVNVGGLVASTLNLTDQDFLAGKDRFTLTDKSTGEVVNQGRINATGGTVALLGATVRNEGTLTAAGGNAILAAGKEISFAAGANGHLHLSVAASALQLAVRNGGAIQADGGQIVLNAQGANALAAAVVSNTGTLQAQTVAQREGKILLLADLDHGGTTQVAGTLDARAPTVGNGGFIETSGTHVKIAEGAHVTTRAAQGQTGTWLIDPADFIVAASGGDITGATLSSNLDNGNVVLQSDNGGVQPNGNGDIFVRDNVAWSSGTTLTLEAQRNIYIDAAITATGQNAGLKLNYGDTRGDITAPAAAGSDYHVRAPVTLSGTNASFAVNGQQYTLIHSLAQLDALDGNVSDTGPVNSVSGYFALATSLDGGGTTYGHSLVGGGAVPFQGTFAGLGNVIRNLTISRGGFASNWSALFAATSASAYIRDLGVAGGGSVSGNLYSGGLVGENKGRIHNSFSTLDVSANNSGGGLVGNNEGTISNSYAQGTVNGKAVLGGLAGSNRGTISNSYSLGNVSGANDSKGYSIGGLIGINGGTVSNAYSLGAATGTDAGGSVGKNSSPTSNTFYATTRSDGTTINASGAYGGATGKSLAELMSAATFSSWSINSGGNRGAIWRIYEGHSTPLLSNLLRPITVTAGLVDTLTYDGRIAGGVLGTYGTSIAGATLSGTLNYRSSSKNAGMYTATDGSLVLSGLWSNQQGYDISYGQTELLINRADLTVSGITATNKTYDGRTSANLSGAAIVTAFGSDQVQVSGTGTGSFADKNVGTGKAVVVSGFTLTGTDAGNYTLVLPTGLTADIAKANLALSGVTAANKTYDGTAAANVNGTASVAAFGSDQVQVSGTGTGSFADKNAGTGKAVVVSGFTLTGTDAGNYTLVLPTGLTATIARKALSISGSRANGKTYDGSTAASIQAGTVAGLVGNETLGVSASGTFDTADAGSRTATAQYTLADGSGRASNYTLADTAGLTATIARKALSIGGSRANGKTYDGSTAASIQAGTVAGLVGNETLGVSASGTFDNANAGTRTATASYALSDGTGRASNYTLGDTTGLTATIARKALSITGSRATGKTYDGTTTASIQGGTVAGLVGNETLGVSASGTFDTANAGSRTATAQYTLADGSGLASNYTLADTAGLTATIARKALSITGSRATGKTYDGSTAASIQAGTVAGLVGNETLGVSASGTFDTADAGSRTATAQYTLADGSGRASNYTLADTAGLTATIARKALSISGSRATGKTYDGSTAASIQAGTVAGLVGNETLGVSASGTFDTANAGTRTATAQYTLADGSGLASNYTLADTTGLTATIARKALSITGSRADGKTYDGTTAASIQAGTVAGLVGNETLGVSASGTFDTANAGSRTATAQYTLADGSGLASNYTLADTAGLTATIARKALSITGSRATGKTYDGSTAASIQAGTVAGLVGNETLGVSASGTFDTADAGSRTATAQYTLADGSGRASNYTLADTAGLTATIARKALSISGSRATGKTYDGSTTASIQAGTVAGLVGNETLGVSASGTFDNANAGTRTATASYALSDGTGRASNYTLGDTTGLTATIARKALSITGSRATGKTYDGTTAASIQAGTVAGLVGNETLGVSASGTFDTANAGTRTATAQYTLADGSGLASNYTLADTTGLTATIARKALSITGSRADGKTYDGTTAASIQAGTVAGLVGNETLGVSATGTFDRADAGTRSATAQYTLADGSGRASNYTLVDTAGLTANIERARLAVTTDDDRRIADGQPYAGGNGVRFSGFVNGENESVLGGQLRYGGSAQGAVVPGEYSIVASGLEAANYRLDYVDGRLLMIAPATAGIPAAGDIERPLRQDIQAREGLARLGAGLNNAASPQPAINLPLVVAHDYIRLEE